MSVSKEGDVWVVRKRIDGKPRKFRPGPSGYPNTKRGAETFEAKLVTEISQNTYCHPDGSTVAEYAERWYKVHALRQTSPKTQQHYRYIINVHINPGLGRVPLSKIKPTHIESFYAGLTRHDGKPGELANSSKASVHRVLNAMLNHAVEMELIPRNPIKSRLAPKPGRGRVGCYDVEQTKQLLMLSEGTRMHVVLALALHTGMRVGEISALRWTDVDLDAQTILVQRSMEQTKKGIREKTTKTDTWRTLGIGEYLVNVLVRHKSDQAQRRLQGSFSEYSGHVVTQKHGEPDPPYEISERWRTFIRSTDLPFLNFHMLRHTHISLLIAQGEESKKIQQRAGHQSITMTMDTYGHLMPGSDKQLAKRLDAALGG